MPRKRTILTGWILACLIAAALGADRAPAQFKDGDTVCVIGDSITHGGKYQKFVYLFYATRFPDRKIRMVNCGISGDTAAGAVRRFEWDIAPHKPTVATILLGMNDVGRGYYGKDKTDEASRKRQQEAIDRYAENMKQLAQLLKKAKCEIIFLTPTIYEQVAEMETPNDFGVNDALGACGAEGKKLAKKHRAGVVDVWAMMNEVSAGHQKDDATFTIVGKDRVHPGDVGHFIVAYAILKAQGIPPCVSKMAIDAKKGKATEETNCKISALKASETEVVFDCLENALPYPVAEAERPALELAPFEKELNQEVLIVDGLAPGTYELAIDDSAVGEYSAEQLKAGINLADIPDTPQHKQAVEVQKLNDLRHSLESGRIRVLAQMRHGVLSAQNIDPDNFETAKKALLDKLEQMKAENSKYYNYYKGQTERYLECKPKEKETIKEWEEAITGMYEVNKPKPHRFVIRKK
ncbi:MAG: SGNH/GDSL hydrolase family protein [Planctomycetota bacterium]